MSVPGAGILGTKPSTRTNRCQISSWAFGNPLTFHSLLGKHYGTARWAYQEGAQGVLEQGYALLRYKRWFKLLAQARVETAMVYFIQHALAREQRRRAAARAAKPPQALPTPGVAGKKAATNISPYQGSTPLPLLSRQGGGPFEHNGRSAASPLLPAAAPPLARGFTALPFASRHGGGPAEQRGRSALSPTPSGLG